MLSKLFLTPVDVNVHIPEGDLLGGLREIELIAAEFPLNGQTHFSVGTRFLELVIFLGCSPSIALSLEEVPTGENTTKGEGFCHIRLRTTGDPCLILSPEHVWGRCRQCKLDIPLNPENRSRSLLCCPKCNSMKALADLDFRKMGGVGQCFVEVWGIHPHEAVPSDELLARLAHLSGGPWQYFYSYGQEKLTYFGGV